MHNTFLQLAHCMTLARKLPAFCMHSLLIGATTAVLTRGDITVTMLRWVCRPAYSLPVRFEAMRTSVAAPVASAEAIAPAEVAAGTLAAGPPAAAAALVTADVLPPELPEPVHSKHRERQNASGDQHDCERSFNVHDRTRSPVTQRTLGVREALWSLGPVRVRGRRAPRGAPTATRREAPRATRPAGVRCFSTWKQITN